MAKIDQRAVLARLIDESREDYAGLSRLIGKNSAYIQQFLKKGSPKRLAEADARRLARYFGVAPSELGAGDPEPVEEKGLARIPLVDVRASAGPGAITDRESQVGHIAFEKTWLASLGRSSSRLSFIRAEGDSMAPTLSDGDDILVDESDAADRLRDGIYVLRIDDSLVVKRLAISPAGGSLTIKSDNPAYPDWTGFDASSVAIIGRVVWAGRKIV